METTYGRDCRDRERGISLVTATVRTVDQEEVPEIVLVNLGMSQ